MDRLLNADEADLWRRVIERVRPMAPRRSIAKPAVPAAVSAPVRPVSVAAPLVAPAAKRAIVGATLDGSWDRQLKRGTVAPELTVDLHGHTLDGAYARVDAALEQASRSGARVLLLVTGKARERGAAPGGGRGAIRAVVTDWLAASRYAGRIAAVRAAHPRHGGAGALYVILRKA